MLHLIRRFVSDDKLHILTLQVLKSTYTQSAYLGSRAFSTIV